jgi:putative hemolysin
VNSALSLSALLGVVSSSELFEGPSDPPTAIALAVLLLLGAAFFSASETALFSLQPMDRQSMAEKARARVDTLLRNPRRTLATLLIGNEVVNLSLSTVTAGLFLHIAPDQPWLNVVIVPPILLIVGEMFPKVFALRNNRSLAPIVAVPLRAFSVVVAPIRVLLTLVAEAALRFTGGSTAPREAELREEQLRALIDQGHRHGHIMPMEQEMIHKVFEFGDLTVSRLMTPRPDVFSVRLNTPWPELLHQLRTAGYSRVPVWQGSPDNIVGVLLVKDLLPLLQERRDETFSPGLRQIQRLLHPPRFVPTTKRSEDMLAEFRKERFHMAIVVDEHGSVAGVVSLDDLLAELVGELLDETDQENPEVKELSARVFQVRGSMDVDDFSTRFDVELPAGEYNTLGGFILAEWGKLPEKGEELLWNGVRFAVMGVESRRVTEVVVHLPAVQSDETRAGTPEAEP